MSTLFYQFCEESKQLCEKSKISLKSVFNFASKAPGAFLEFAVGNTRLRKKGLSPTGFGKGTAVASSLMVLAGLAIAPIVAAASGSAILAFGAAAACVALPYVIKGQTSSLYRSGQHDTNIRDPTKQAASPPR